MAEVRRVAPGLRAGHLLPHDRIPPPYSSPGTPTKLFKGFLSTVELEEFGSGKIYPHENTRAAAKTDRLNLLEACGANFSPIISLYSDPQNVILTLIEQAIASEKPRIDFQDDVGFRQRLWSVTNRAYSTRSSRS